MQIKNAAAGKIGNYVLGPKQYLKEDLKLGEVAICVGRDENQEAPYSWIIGGMNNVIDYLHLAEKENKLPKDDINKLLSCLDEAKGNMPLAALERLAGALGMKQEDLLRTAKLAQVYISAPVAGIKEFSTGKGLPLFSTNTLNRQSTH